MLGHHQHSAATMVAEDRLSALPDEVLQAILAWLPTTDAAARTSVLSRRWRGLWKRVPALSFHVDPKAPPGASSSTPDAVDAALNAYSASAALNRLALDVHPSTPAPRISQWLRFASQRLAGELRLSFSGAGAQRISRGRTMPRQRPMIELPACERATRIELSRINFLLRLPSAGAFTSLRALRISAARFVHGDVGHLVSTQCPRLRELEMSNVGVAAAAHISISSTSLQRLVFRQISISKKARIVVAAPSLYYMALENYGDISAAATIVAPMLAELIWNHSYDPSRHRIQDADRQIYRLAIITCRSNRALFQRFDAVDEMSLHLSMLPGVQGFKKFAEDMEELPKTKVLEVKGLSTKQHLGPAMLHLLKKFTWLTKLKIDLLPVNTWNPLCSHDCKCLEPGSWKTDGVTLDSLEDLEITSFTGSEDDTEFLKLLFGCKIKLRRMAIHTEKDVSESGGAEASVESGTSTLHRPRV